MTPEAQLALMFVLLIMAMVQGHWLYVNSDPNDQPMTPAEQAIEMGRFIMSVAITFYMARAMVTTVATIWR